MKVLFAISTHRSVDKPKHGAERQLLGQARALSEVGVDVSVDNILWNSPENITQYDIIHMVNSNGQNGPHQALARHAKAEGVPVVATPTFWPPNEINVEVSDKAQQVMNLHAQTLIPWLEESTFITPNAKVEASKLTPYLGDFDYRVIYNAVDLQEIEEIEQNQTPPPEEWGDYVVCVGRMEERKNQWRLLYAMQGLWQEGINAHLVMMGKGGKSYLKKLSSVLERNKDKVTLDPQIKSPATVMNVIKHARVLAMPSMVETPGLVALEAGALGTSLAITEVGSTEEYFEDKAHYCDPMRVESIADAVKEAWNDDRDFSEEIKEKYNYENAAKELKDVYKNILGGI